MSEQKRLFLQVAGAVVVAAIPLWFVGGRYHRFRRAGESGAQVWFYDQQKQRAYPAPRDTIPPDGQGVRAIVVAFRGEENDPAKRRIAYLERYGQPLKDALERLRLARSSGQTMQEAAPARDSDFFRTNNLVRRVDGVDWFSAGSPEGRKITSEWRSWRGPDGRELVVCVP